MSSKTCYVCGSSCSGNIQGVYYKPCCSESCKTESYKKYDRENS